MIGAKASRRGYDVKTAKDHQLVFSADFPTLKITKQGSFSVPAAPSFTVPSTIIEHGLDITPAFFVFRASTDYPNRRELFFGTNLRVDKDKLAWWETANGLTGYYFLLDYDLEDTNIKVESKNISSGDESKESTKQKKFGIKISERGEDVKSTKKIAYSTEEREPIIDQVGHGIYTGGWVNQIFTHNLGYAPQFLLFMRDLNTSGSWQLIMGSSLDFGYNTNKKTCLFATGYADKPYSFIILKEPII
jgi:hypothetical protein